MSDFPNWGSSSCRQEKFNNSFSSYRGNEVKMDTATTYGNMFQQSLSGSSSPHALKRKRPNIYKTTLPKGEHTVDFSTTSKDYASIEPYIKPIRARRS
jgi:hypothetical protein